MRLHDVFNNFVFAQEQKNTLLAEMKPGTVIAFNAHSNGRKTAFSMHYVLIFRFHGVYLNHTKHFLSHSRELSNSTKCHIMSG